MASRLTWISGFASFHSAIFSSHHASMAAVSVGLQIVSSTGSSAITGTVVAAVVRATVSAIAMLIAFFMFSSSFTLDISLARREIYRTRSTPVLKKRPVFSFSLISPAHHVEPVSYCGYIIIPSSLFVNRIWAKYAPLIVILYIFTIIHSFFCIYCTFFDCHFNNTPGKKRTALMPDT